MRKTASEKLLPGSVQTILLVYYKAFFTRVTNVTELLEFETERRDLRSGIPALLSW